MTDDTGTKTDPEGALEYIDENPDTTYIRFYLEGRLEKHDLGYDDWLAALRWGDVAVVIPAEWAAFFDDVDPEDARTYYRLVDGGDLIEQWPADEFDRATMTHHHFYEVLRAHYDRVELVPLAASPFGGDDGA